MSIITCPQETATTAGRPVRADELIEGMAIRLWRHGVGASEEIERTVLSTASCDHDRDETVVWMLPDGRARFPNDELIEVID